MKFKLEKIANLGYIIVVEFSQLEVLATVYQQVILSDGDLSTLANM